MRLCTQVTVIWFVSHVTIRCPASLPVLLPWISWNPRKFLPPPNLALCAMLVWDLATPGSFAGLLFLSQGLVHLGSSCCSLWHSSASNVGSDASHISFCDRESWAIIFQQDSWWLWGPEWNNIWKTSNWRYDCSPWVQDPLRLLRLWDPSLYNTVISHPFLPACCKGQLMLARRLPCKCVFLLWFQISSSVLKKDSYGDSYPYYLKHNPWELIFHPSMKNNLVPMCKAFP